MPMNPKKMPRAKSSGRKILSNKATAKTMASVLLLFMVLADDIIGYADREGLAPLPFGYLFKLLSKSAMASISAAIARRSAAINFISLNFLFLFICFPPFSFLDYIIR